MDAPPPDWPAHTAEVRPWRQQSARGPRADRQVHEITVNLPPLIRDLDYEPSRPLAAMVNASAGGLGHLDLAHGRTLEALGRLQLRTESVDTSRIEDIQASLADYGRAVLGVGANPSAREMAAATAAMSRLIADARDTRSIRSEAVLQAHRELFARTADQRLNAGRFRSVQNWVGGSDYAPRDALWVPPPPELVGDYLDDLFAFANRDDLPPLVQAAIAHAQFESIHPFIDGNGRIGRALIQAVLRRRRATRHLAVPIASALVAVREKYFDALRDYRRGRAETIIALLARSASIATTESWQTAETIERIRATWHERSGARPGTPTYRLLDLLTEDPIVNIAMVAERLGSDTDTAAAAIADATRAGVLRSANRSRRSPVWLATEVLDEVQQLSLRTQSASRDEREVRHRSYDAAH